MKTIELPEIFVRRLLHIYFWTTYPPRYDEKQIENEFKEMLVENGVDEDKQEALVSLLWECT